VQTRCKVMLPGRACGRRQPHMRWRMPVRRFRPNHQQDGMPSTAVFASCKSDGTMPHLRASEQRTGRRGAKAGARFSPQPRIQAKRALFACSKKYARMEVRKMPGADIARTLCQVSAPVVEKARQAPPQKMRSSSHGSAGRRGRPLLRARNMFMRH